MQAFLNGHFSTPVSCFHDSDSHLVSGKDARSLQAGSTATTSAFQSHRHTVLKEGSVFHLRASVLRLLKYVAESVQTWHFLSLAFWQLTFFSKPAAKKLF
jgi:hypothetical protein